MSPGGGTGRVLRLTAYDEHCLRVETPARPLQLGILATLDGRALADSTGQLRLADLRRDLEARVARVPELRRVVYRPGPLAGRPLWVDDPHFGIDRHVQEVERPPPGDEGALMARVEQLMARPLDRSHPLWGMWFLTGPSADRVAVLVVLHHALADGVTAMRLIRSLLEPPTAGSEEDTRPHAGAVPPPRWAALVLDNLQARFKSVLGLARPATWRLAVEVVGYGWRAGSLARKLPPSSLNAPVGPRRRLAVMRADLATVKRVARAHGCGANDVVLGLVAGGVRALLAARGEPVERLRPRAGVAVALFSRGHASEAGNDIGTLHVPLPISEPDAPVRLQEIAAARERARQGAFVGAEPAVRAWLGRFGPVRRSLEHQRLVNLAETYLPGPPVSIDVLGAPVLDLLPIAPLAGNLGLSFVALSYAGRLAITVRADADQFPDLDVMLPAMARDWQAMAGSVAPSAP